jgi:hypothetical protein
VRSTLSLDVRCAQCARAIYESLLWSWVLIMTPLFLVSSILLSRITVPSLWEAKYNDSRRVTQKEKPSGEARRSQARASVMVSLIELNMDLLHVQIDRCNIDARGSKDRVDSTRHGGERHDSAQQSVKNIIISRILKTRDERAIQECIVTPFGGLLIQQLQAVVLSVCADAQSSFPQTHQLTAANIQTLFNLSGSTLWRSALYNAQLLLPHRLPFSFASRVYLLLLDTIGTSHSTPTGAALDVLLAAQGCAEVTPDTESGEAIILEFTSVVLEHMRKQLGTQKARADQGAEGSGAGGRSSSPSSSSTAPTTIRDPPSPKATPTASSPLVNPTASLRTNCTSRVQQLVRRPLTRVEERQLNESLDEGLSLLPSGTAENRRVLLTSSFVTALEEASAAQLYACVLEVLRSHETAQEGRVDFSALVQGIVSSCSAVAALALLDVFGD